MSAIVNGTTATRDCQDTSGLPLRDFQAGLEKRFTSGKQRVLKALVGFAKDQDGPTYDFLQGMLGEIEVQQDGYWQPLFDRGLARPQDVADTSMEEISVEPIKSIAVPATRRRTTGKPRPRYCGRAATSARCSACIGRRCGTLRRPGPARTRVVAPGRGRATRRGR